VPPDSGITVGDFVYCRSAYHRTQLGLPREAGLVLEVKRSNYRILYGADSFCWLPGATLVRVEGEVHLDTTGGRLHRLLKLLDPLDCELVSQGREHRATMRIDRIDAGRVDAIRAFLGSDFVSLEVVPEGMAFMLAEVRFRT
jgi:hypothetical protein